MTSRYEIEQWYRGDVDWYAIARRSNGLSAYSCQNMGLGPYDGRPDPNGLPYGPETHAKFMAGRKILVDRARKFIEEFDSAYRVRNAAKLITTDQAQKDIEAIRQWANSRQT